MNINNYSQENPPKRLARSCDRLVPIKVFQSCPKVTNVGAKHNWPSFGNQANVYDGMLPCQPMTSQGTSYFFIFEHCQSLDGFQSIETTRSFPLAENDLSFARSGMAAKYSYLCVARHSNPIVTAYHTKEKWSILKRRCIGN